MQQRDLSVCWGPPAWLWAPVGGVPQRWEGWGHSRDMMVAPPISYTRSRESGEDARGWHRARDAVSSGSSFPRNPLGTRLGIPGNTVLGATARRPIPWEPQAAEEPGMEVQGHGEGWEWEGEPLEIPHGG